MLWMIHKPEECRLLANKEPVTKDEETKQDKEQWKIAKALSAFQEKDNGSVEWLLYHRLIDMCSLFTIEQGFWNEHTYQNLYVICA